MNHLPPSVRLVEISPGYPVFEITHATCTARVALHGAHVMSWKPVDEEEVFYLSPDAVLTEGKAIRGGVPICWPWFNAHPSDASLPSHGIARSRFWELKAAEEDAGGVTLSFTLREGNWHAEATMRLGQVFELSLESFNHGAEPLKIAGALHSYFKVGQISEIEIEGLDGAGYLNTVGGRKREQQEGNIRFDSEVDFIYDSQGSARILDRSANRVVQIEKQGSPSTVVWNPWEEKAKALADLPDDGYLDFVCVETAIANSKAIELTPGERHLLAMKVSVAKAAF